MIGDIIKQTLKGKTVNRILMNMGLRRFDVHGCILDLGGGNMRSSYFEFLRKHGQLKVVSVDISFERKPDIIADLEKPLLIKDGEFDSVLCFNLLEHIYDYRQLVSETRRILKPGGQLLGYVPFLVKYHPDPHDYFRYTQEGLKKILSDASFVPGDIKIHYVGHGPLTAAWSQMEYVLPRFLRWPVTLCVLWLDSVVLKLKPVFKNKYPLGYIFTAKK